ncbi:MAG: HDIG domain-containing protein [Clostridia bacterium]|nr:HDIG domain-containing protein [Clostridia bacterium]
MINDIKDLSTVEKEKQIARKKFISYLFKCIGGVIVASMIIALFSICVIDSIGDAFTPERAMSTIGRTLMTFLFMVIFMLAFYGFEYKNVHVVRDFWITMIVFVITFMLVLGLSQVTNFSRYAMPIALIGLVLIQVINVRSAVLATAFMGIIVIISYHFSTMSSDYNMARITSAVICNLASPLMICFFFRKHFSRLKFLTLTLLVPILAQPLVLMMTLASVTGEPMEFLYNVAWSYGSNVLAAILFMPLVAIIEGVFNITDDFRLSELCYLSNPLLKRLASEAPGTFNHSLVVGTVAEACASAIGENPNLARCAAYYHDIGKLKAPLYFTENQSTYNPHDELIPEVSVSMITSHTLFGEILAKQNRLPSEIIDICRQHHGTAPVGYFYRKALNLQENDDLAVDKYKYAGPKPQTKIAAIIMIADTLEAAIRAYMPPTREEYAKRIDALVDEKIRLKQFDECPITLGDIAIIKKTAMESLASIHHSRIDYDKNKKNKIAK